MTSKKPLLSQLLDDCDMLIYRSEKGDVEASKGLLRKASSLLDGGQPLPAELSDWLSSKLKAIASGAEAKSTLNLTRPRGKPQQYCEEFQRDVADFIRHSESGRHKIDGKDGKTSGAYLEAEESFGINANTAEKFYRNQIDIIIAGEKADQEIRDENQD